VRRIEAGTAKESMIDNTVELLASRTSRSVTVGRGYNFGLGK
jgi:hypothetical protein